MSYIVNKTDGNIAAVVDNGTIDTTTSLNLVGRGYNTYGEVIAEDLVALMENFSNYTAPRNPIIGQLWYNKTLLQLQIFDGNRFVPLNNINVGASAPVTPRAGDFWYNTTKKQLFYLRENNWELIAPAYTQAQGKSDLIVESFRDAAGTAHTAVCIYSTGKRVIVISSDDEYNTLPVVAGFSTVKPGINIANSFLLVDAVLHGTADRSNKSAGLEPLADATYMHANTNTSTVGTVSIVNDNAMIVGANADLTITTSDSSINFTAVANSPMILNGYGSSKLVLDNATNWIAINKTTPTADLDVGGTINADESITSQNGYGFGDLSTITSSNGTITISPDGTDSVVLQSDGAISTQYLTTETLTVNTGLNSSAADNYFLGNVDAATPPTVSSHLTNKEYVDQTVLSVLLPRGCVMMWYGAYGNVPAGWAVCDGTNGTPNLIDKFVFGAGNTASLGDAGGNNNLVVSTNTEGGHTHVGNASAGGNHDHGGNTQGHALTAGEVANHQHNFVNVYALKDDANPPLLDRHGDRVQHYDGWNDDNDGDSGNPAQFDSVTDFTGNSDPHVHGITASGTHEHTVLLETAGSHQHTVGFDNRPAWVALFYIMRIA